MIRFEMTKGRFAAVVAAAAVALGAVAADTAERRGALRFTITGIEPEREGRILCALYRRADNWLEDDPYRNTVAFVNDASANCVFNDVPAGVYATAALHDEDGDSEMDTTFGFPDEGYCASRDAEEETIFAPDWEDAAFRFRGKPARVTADIEY